MSPEPTVIGVDYIDIVLYGVDEAVRMAVVRAAIEEINATPAEWTDQGHRHVDEGIE